MAYRGAWRGRGLAYDQPSTPDRPVTPLHDGREEPLPDKWADSMQAPTRQGPGLAPEEEDSFTCDYGRGWVVDRTPQDHAHGMVGGGGQSDGRVQALSEAAHDEHYGAVEYATEMPPIFFQNDRKVLWRQETAQPLGHGSQAALGRGLNGLDMNNDPSVQQYGTRRQLQVERKFPSRRIWNRQLTGFRPTGAVPQVVSKSVGDTTQTSWAPTLTMARTGKTSPPVLRRTPRNWTEAVTSDGGSVPEPEQSWGL